MTPVRALSGAKEIVYCLLVCSQKPSNLLILDEPTNDLDVGNIRTIVEELVDAYQGTVLLVSHDREFA